MDNASHNTQEHYPLNEVSSFSSAVGFTHQSPENEQHEPVNQTVEPTLTSGIKDNTLARLPLSQIVEYSLGNTRSKRDPKKFQELIDAIRPRGVFQPIVVRPHPHKAGMYERIAGNGRYEASVELNLPDIPVVIKQLTDREAIEIQLIENSAREDLSLVDEAKAAQRWIGFYEGDRNAAASRLGWSVKKTSERLELLRCHADVLESLELGKIKPAHAMVLAPFSDKIQLATLASIESEKWSVQYLKERAGKAQTYLAKAKFDTGACNGCPSNSEAQAGLFDTDNRAKCSNISCFKEKTADFVTTAKQQAEEQYGKVLLWMEVNKNDRNTVSEEIVGEDQFSKGCKGCESRVTLMDDRSGQEGNLVKNQCIDRVCFKGVTEPESAAEETTTTTNASDSTKKTGNTKSTSKKTSVVKQKTNKQVIEQSRNELRLLAATDVNNHPSFSRALTLTLMSKQSGYQPDIEKWEDCRYGTHFNTNVISCLSVSPSKLDEEIAKAVTFLTVEAKHSDESGKKFIDLVIGAFATDETSRDKAIMAWNPTKDNLGLYTKDALVGLCTDAGFKGAYEQADNKVTFAKLSGGGKADFINGILDFDFDWSHYAPEKGYLDQIK